MTSNQSTIEKLTQECTVACYICGSERFTVYATLLNYSLITH